MTGRVVDTLYYNCLRIGSAKTCEVLAAMSDSRLQRLPSPDALTKLKSSIRDKAFEAVSNAPKKVEELTAMLENKLFKCSAEQLRQLLVFPVDGEVTTNNKKRKLEDGVPELNTATSVPSVVHNVPTNSIMSQLKVFLKTEASFFLEFVSTVRFWVQLNIPRIEDGNNFGVQVQEELLQELGKAEDTAFSAVDLIAKYYAARGKLVTKCLKYPSVQDFRESVHEIDEKYYTDIIFSFRELRNNYANIYDMVQKNYTKIIKPRSEHTNSMF